MPPPNSSARKASCGDESSKRPTSRRNRNWRPTRMKRYRTRTALAAALLGILASANAAMAQDAYPSRRVTVVVPSPAGSTTDSLARLVADQLQRKWGQTVIVENNGRGLNFGAEQVSRAPADGYTLLVTAPMPL